MPNYRVFYPILYPAFGTEASPGSGFIPAHGVQSVGMTTSFNLEQVFELGQLEIYENIENLPNVEMTFNKVLDGYPLIYHLATQGATSKTLVNRTNIKSSVVLSIFPDSQEYSTGTPLTQAYCSGMYVSSLNYTFPVQGNCTESVTLVGNDKIWKTSSFLFSGHFTSGTDSPASGVQRRQHVKMGNAGAGGSVFPSIIPGMTVTNGSGYNIESAGTFGAHVQDCSVSCNLGREDLFELGRRKPYYRYASFPVAVDTTINISPGGQSPGDLVNANSDATNLSNEPIIIKISDGSIFDMGTKNKLQSVTQSGAETGGGVASVSYAFQNFNKCDITSLTDPMGLT
jgi:hypothetical protein